MKSYITQIKAVQIKISSQKVIKYNQKNIMT